MSEHDVNLWASVDHALEYLARADSIPHRTEGESALLEFLPPRVDRMLDLGSGDGRLLALIRLARPDAASVALDFSPAMLERLRVRLGSDRAASIVEHDLGDSLPRSLGRFDLIVSSFAIHHVAHERKRSLFAEVFEHLTPCGAFLNLEHVASATPSLHRAFLRALDVDEANEDPSNKLLDVETQLRWFREIGFVDVDCHWKWRELALLAGSRP